jgi:radical SAM protein with 4Fe4S-binding SPASM domain
LDGLQENHDWLRGKNGSFDKAIKAIQLLSEIPNFLFDVVTCVNSKNFNELEDLKSMLIEMKVAKWRLFIVDPIGRAKDNPELFITDNQFCQLMDFIAINRQQGEIMTAFGCDGFLGKYEANVRQGIFFCRAGINAGSVLANGDISACPNINRGFVQGNIYKDDFMDIWNSKFQQFRNREGFKTGKCAECEVWKWCRSDGMHLHEPNNPNPIVCHYQKINC